VGDVFLELNPILSDNRKTNLSQQPAEGSLVKLTNQQNALHDALTRNDVDLGNMYLGTLFVLAQTENPDRLALAAHGIRELMDKIPYYFDIQITAQKESLKPKVNEIETEWNKTIENS